MTSSKVFALLDVPLENREDFITSHNLEDSTVRELKKEIQEYKEKNGLLTKKQQETLEEKRRVEQENKSENGGDKKSELSNRRSPIEEKKKIHTDKELAKIV